MSDHVWELLEKPWRHYTCDGKMTVPNGLKIGSVTQILGTLDKPALPGWAANVTAEGAWTLFHDKKAAAVVDPIVEGIRLRVAVLEKQGKTRIAASETRRADRIVKYGYFAPHHWRQLQGDLRAAGLDHNTTRDEAALRGTTVHGIFEDWVNHRKIPNVDDFPQAWHGYIRALAAWLMAMDGCEFINAEMIVGSVTHGFAGKCDTVAVTTGRDGRRVRWDLKTSRQTYAKTHFRQLGAYELAAVEMGEQPTDDLAIVCLRQDGTFRSSFASEVEWKDSPGESFLRVLDVWRDDQPLKKHEDAEYKIRRSEGARTDGTS